MPYVKNKYCYCCNVRIVNGFHVPVVSLGCVSCFHRPFALSVWIFYILRCQKSEGEVSGSGIANGDGLVRLAKRFLLSHMFFMKSTIDPTDKLCSAEGAYCCCTGCHMSLGTA